MFDVGRFDAIDAREVKAANDADALGDVPMHARHLIVASCTDQCCVILLVQTADRSRDGAAFGRRDEPDRFQRFQVGRRVSSRAQPCDARQLEYDAQVVELLELAEIDRQHVPANLRLDTEQAFVAQPKECLANRRAAHAEALTELSLRETVAGDELEVVNLRFQRVVYLLGQLAGAPARSADAVVHDVNTLTCAATTRQPSSQRTQVWLCRPMPCMPGRVNSVMAVAKSLPKVVMTVFASVRARPLVDRAARKARICSMPTRFSPTP